jgi:5'-phosphate synthase pdxT subunit
MAIDALILSGGESTAMRKLLSFRTQSTCSKIDMQGVPVWGTCAGVILLAQGGSVAKCGHKGGPECLWVQIIAGCKGKSSNYGQGVLHGVLRAPRIRSLGNEVAVLASLQECVVGVRQNNILLPPFT